MVNVETRTCSDGIWIEKNNPDDYTRTTPTSMSADKENAFCFLFEETNIIGIKSVKFEFSTGEFSKSIESEAYLKLYSGSPERLTYNILNNECTQHKWNNNNEKIKLKVFNYKRYIVDLSEHSNILYNIAKSGKKIIIVIGTDVVDPSWMYINVGSGGREVKLTLEYIVKPIASVEFPNNINIEKNKEQIFTWTYDSGALEQKSYNIGWSNDGGSNWNDESCESSNVFHTFPENIFPIGIIDWRIKVTNTEGIESDYSYGRFTCVGNSNAPIIKHVTQNSIPEITWESEQQAAFEIQIMNSNKIVYSSGFIGGNDNKYRPNVLMKNGTYIIYLRIINVYGYISETGNYVHILNALEPESSAEMELVKNNFFGAILKCRDILGDGYIIRVCDGKETVVCKYNGNHIIDYETKSGSQYTYILRDHVEGYKDVSRIIFKPNFTGVILHDINEPENFVNIRLNEDEYVSVDDQITKNTVYKKCIGRIYPIKETDNQRDEETQISGFLHFEECSILRELYEKDKTVIFRSKEQCFHADISEYKEKNYHNIGYIVRVTLRRIDEENGVITV